MLASVDARIRCLKVVSAATATSSLGQPCDAPPRPRPALPLPAPPLAASAQRGDGGRAAVLGDGGRAAVLGDGGLAPRRRRTAVEPTPGTRLLL
jgi:hypothetical protein